MPYGRNNSKPRPQNRILVLKGSFQNFQRATILFAWDSPPPPPPPAPTRGDLLLTCVLVKVVCNLTRVRKKLTLISHIYEGSYHFIVALMVRLQDLWFLDHAANFLTSILSKFSLPEWHSIRQCNRDVYWFYHLHLQRIWRWREWTFCKAITRWSIHGRMSLQSNSTMGNCILWNLSGLFSLFCLSCLVLFGVLPIICLLISTLFSHFQT